MHTRSQDPHSGAHPHNLPALLSSFIGRKPELAEVRQLLRTERLVTLTGAGGCGKTRLALHAAADALPAFEDGVWLTELASLADGTLVAQAVASSLKVREQASRPLLDTLVDNLLSRQTLLVLDNCEHLVQACAQLAESLLQACPSLIILATSREPLGLAGEVVRSVPPLSLPETPEANDSRRRQNPPEGRSEAMQLFIARAQAAVPGFALTDENAVAAAEICLRLDGMPLAIELAAARLRALSVQQVAQLLSDRFQLLTGGSRTAPARQRTLEATLDWSHALLSDTEQLVWQRLSIFAGGCTLEAAEAVCASDEVHAAEVLDAVSHLVDKSLVAADAAGGEVRYRLLETIREYALKRLSESEGTAETKNRHLEYFVRWAENAEPHLRSARQLEWVTRLEVEHGNLRSALEWSQLADDRAEAGLRLAAVAGLFWQLHGYHTEGHMRLSTALAHRGAQAKTAARAKALHQLAVLAFLHSDYQAVRTLETESLSIWRTMGVSGRLGVADALEMSAEVETETGNYTAAFPLFEEALVLFRELENLPGIGDTLKMLGWSLMRIGEYAQAEARFNDALVVCRASGDLRHIASTLAGSGELAIRRGQYDRAQGLLAESLEHSRSLGDKWGIAIDLGSLGWLALARRDFEGARALLGESLTIRAGTGDQGGMAWCLEKLAQAAAVQTESQRAATLLGAAAALRAPVDSVVDPTDQPEYARMLSRIRSALGEQAFTACWVEGEGMPAETMVDYALRQPAPTLASSARLDKERYGGLTGRERQVAALIAQGRSNREIAEAMTVGVKTVETYVTRILDKLGFESRVQIATWAVGNRLEPSAKEE